MVAACNWVTFPPPIEGSDAGADVWVEDDPFAHDAAPYDDIPADDASDGPEPSEGGAPADGSPIIYEVEPNDTWYQDRIRLAASARIRGSWSGAADQDWYAITLLYGQKVNVTARAADGTCGLNGAVDLWSTEYFDQLDGGCWAGTDEELYPLGCSVNYGEAACPRLEFVNQEYDQLAVYLRAMDVLGGAGDYELEVGVEPVGPEEDAGWRQ